MTDTVACTPEGGLEAFADALFRRHRLDIPCEGEAEHIPLTKDKAGRRDGQGRLYRYWTCSKCQPRTKRNCRSYIEAARRVLGAGIVRDIALEILEERRTALEPYDLLDAWVRGKSLVHAVAASSKRKSSLPDRDIPNKRARVASDPDSPLDLSLSETKALSAVYAAREAIDRCIEALTGIGGDISPHPTDDSSRSTLPDRPDRALSSSLSSPVLHRGLASCPVDPPAAALYSSTALATPRSLPPLAVPATFRLPGRSSVDKTRYRAATPSLVDAASHRAAAPSPARFSDLSSLPSSPIAFKRSIERKPTPHLSATSPRLSASPPHLSATVSRPDSSSSLRPIADARGRGRVRRAAKKQKEPEPKRNSGGSKENVPPAEEELWTATDRLR